MNEYFQSSLYEQRSAIQDALKELGKEMLAYDASRQDNVNILNKYVCIIQSESIKQKKEGVLDQLQFLGLLY